MNTEEFGLMEIRESEKRAQHTGDILEYEMVMKAVAEDSRVLEYEYKIPKHSKTSMEITITAKGEYGHIIFKAGKINHGQGKKPKDMQPFWAAFNYEQARAMGKALLKAANAQDPPRFWSREEEDPTRERIQKVEAFEDGQRAETDETAETAETGESQSINIKEITGSS